MDFFVQQLAEARCRVFGSIWKYRMQWFSWRTCTFRAAGANVEYRRHELLGGTRRHDPREIDKIGLSKMQFRAFPGPELGNRNYERNSLSFFRLCALHN